MQHAQRRLLAMGLGVAMWAGMHLVVACDEPQATAGARTVYEASHPALDALLAAAPVDDPMQAVYLVEPAAGAVLDASAPFTFRWRVGAGDAALHAPIAPLARPRQRLALRTPLAVRERGPSLLSKLSPLGIAHAHGPPISGRGYYLTAVDEEGVVRYRLWTTALEHTPEGSDWRFLTEASGALRVTIVNALFNDDIIAPGGGPWLGTTATLSF